LLEPDQHTSTVTNLNKNNTTENYEHQLYQYINPIWVGAGNGGPLPEYGWNPSSSSTVSAGEDTRVQGEGWPTAGSYIGDYNPPDQSLQTSLEYSNDAYLLSGSPTEVASDLSVNTEINPLVFQCSECPESLSKRHLLNKHLKKHDPPFKCTLDGCNKSFTQKRDYERHLDAIHPTQSTTLWVCPYEGCKYSGQYTAGSPRKDNMKRHMRTQHGG